MFKQFLMAAGLLFVWLLLGMVFTDWFVTPLDLLEPFLMPWTGLHSIPANIGFIERISYMEELLNRTYVVTNISFFSMVVLFTVFSIYLTFVYQQKKRRYQENRLLLLKNQEIGRRNEFIQYISATIGHEFKNNLGRIKRRIDLISGLPAEPKRLIDNNLNKLFADIDIFKKISDKREAGLVDFAKVYIRDVLVELSKQNSDFADIFIEDNVPPPPIFASLTLLTTVFENLIDNAIKYKKSDKERARIHIAFSMDSDGRRRYVTLSFKDKGIGMTKQTADLCFYKSKSNDDGGWGRGLYFAKYVVGLHAGKIRVGKEYTEQGKGTEIIINLPFVEEDVYV